jgi:hypothetical protein
MTVALSDVTSWIDYLSKTDIPVLKHTARELERLKEDDFKLSPRAIANVIINDPLMIFRLLSYTQKHKSKHQQHDVIQIEQAIMLMGTDAFFKNLPTNCIVEDLLKTNLPALTHLLRLMKRGHRAGHYAMDWAVLHKDIHMEEVRIAALLHDLAEMLMWCFVPDQMNTILNMQHADKTLRSKAAQEQILGFRLNDLQKELVNIYQLPPLLSKLMEEENADETRVKNVTLAVNLARHSANGWDDAALPDDYHEIAEFLRVDVERAKFLIGVPKESGAI